MNYTSCPVCGAEYDSVGLQRLTCVMCGSDFYQVKSVQPESFDYLREDRTSYWLRECRRIREMINRPIVSHLDIGAGYGDFIRMMGADHRYALETNAPMAMTLESWGVRTFNHLCYVLVPFDIITAYAVIEHMNHAGDFFERLCLMLNPGGILAIMVPTLKTPMGRLKGNVHDSPPMHVAFPSTIWMDETARKMGLTLVRRTYETGGTLPRYVKPKLLAQVIGRIWDATPFNRLPVGDHIYSYWRKSL